MQNRSQPTWLLAALLIGAGCLVVLCLVGLVIFGAAFIFGAAPAFGAVAPAVETNSPTAAQSEQCRQALGIRANVTIDVEWYYFQEGFQDDFLECRLTARATALEEIFDSARVDTARLDEQQEVAPGRYLTLGITELEPGLFLISGSWFET
jgi:hypothetical protein